MKIKVPQTVSNVESFEDLKRYTDQVFNQLVNIFNGGIEFGDNVAASFTTFTFTLANTSYQVNHSLGKLPTGYIAVKRNKAAVIYDGIGMITESSISLQSNTAASTATIMVF